MLDVTVTYKIIINNFIRHFKNAMSAIYDTIKKILFNNLKMKTQKSEKINIAKKEKKRKWLYLPRYNRSTGNV